jgi:hypothetical protein
MDWNWYCGFSQSTSRDQLSWSIIQRSGSTKPISETDTGVDKKFTDHMPSNLKLG